MDFYEKPVIPRVSRGIIPPGYKNIKTLRWNLEGRAEQLHQLVDEYHPQFIYYNEKPEDGYPMPPIEEMLSDKKVKLIKSFESKGRSYQKNPDDRFVIYEVLYKKF